MVIELIQEIKSTRAELRKFGITIGILLVLLGGLLFLRRKDYYFYFLIFSGVFLCLGLVAPVVLKPVQKIWMTLAIFIGWFATRVILLVLFYLVFTPIGLLAKVFNKNFLDIEFDRNANSYWIARELAEFDQRSYEKQF